MSVEYVLDPSIHLHKPIHLIGAYQIYGEPGERSIRRVKMSCSEEGSTANSRFPLYRSLNSNLSFAFRNKSSLTENRVYGF